MPALDTPLTALLAAIGNAVGGPQGALIGLVIAAISNFAMYFGSASTVLRAYRARLLARPSFARAVNEARYFRVHFPLGAPDRD